MPKGGNFEGKDPAFEGKGPVFEAKDPAVSENAQVSTPQVGTPQVGTQQRGLWKFFVYSAIGIFMFFIPVNIAGKNTIGLDHLVSWISAGLKPALPYIALAIIGAGAAYPFVTGRWREGGTRMVFSFLNVLGLITGILLVFGIQRPLGINLEFLFAEDLGPFLYNALVIPVGMIVPIGAVFLALLVGYGLMEFIGVLAQPLMRPVWRTPGRSAIDAVASFVGSYSLGLLITNRVYKQGMYTAREAAIIATGFSTVSVTFMLVVARTLELTDYWLQYFFASFIITMIVTAITVRLPPLRSISQQYHPAATPAPEQKVTGNRFAQAWREAKDAVGQAPTLPRAIGSSFKDGVIMAMAILPSILSVGLIGLILARFTPIFDWLGYLFLPITWALGLPQPELAAQASATGIAEMFLPATMVAGAESLQLRFVIAVVCISAIIFFSALVPSILATEIPLKIWQLVIIWAERVALTLILTIPVSYLLFGLP